MARTLYAYAGCSTCKKAIAWLRDAKVAVDVVPIVERPPSAAALTKLIARSGLPAKKWFNTSGESYRTLVRERGKDAVAALDDAAITQLLAADGKMIKRPVLVTDDAVLVGFDEARYSALLAP